MPRSASGAIPPNIYDKTGPIFMIACPIYLRIDTQARALFDQQAGIVAVDVEDTGDLPLVVVAIAGVSNVASQMRHFCAYPSQALHLLCCKLLR